jgi:AAA domain (dynein-related subfamily)
VSLQLIEVYLAADTPVMLWGPPGSGKTSALLSLATARSAHMEVLIGSTSDPVDVGGYLIPHGGEVVCDPPPWAKRLRAALDSGRAAWLFLDELSCSPPAVQAALLRIVNERQVGGLDLRGIRVVGASNPVETATAEGEVGPAMSNRWAHVDWRVDSAHWAAQTLSAWGRRDTTAGYARAAAAVTSYLSRDTEALSPSPGVGQRAWPSPRSWTGAIHALAQLDDMRSALARQVVAGLVGEPAAQAWAAYVAESDLPDPELVLSGAASLPLRGDRISACLTSVAGAALISHANRDTRVRRAWELVATCRRDQVIGAARALLLGSDEVPDVAVAIGNQIRAL